MTRPLLILRPEPGAFATARAAESMSLRAIVAPLFEIVPVLWAAPDPADFDALLLTSANAARHAGPALTTLASLPVYAVGEATASAARSAGLTVCRVGDGDANAVLALATADGANRLVHLAGREHRDPGGQLARRIVYESDAVDRLPDAARAALIAGAIALLHSPRAAALFAKLAGDANIPRDTISIAALSEAVASAAGTGWESIAVAARPSDDALLAAAARLCEG